MKRFTGLLLFVFLSTAFSSAQERYYDEQDGFSIVIPSGWKRLQADDESLANWVRASDQAELSVFSADVGGASLTDMATAFKKDFQPSQILSETAVDLGGRKGRRFLVELEMEGVKVSSITNMLVADRTMYATMLIVSSKVYRTSPESYHAIGDSFLLEEGD